MEIYGTAREATDDNIIRRMRFACWIPIRKTIDTHSECVILVLVAFPQQKWLCELATMLRLYVHCLSCLVYAWFVLRATLTELPQRSARSVFFLYCPEDGRIQLLCDRSNIRVELLYVYVKLIVTQTVSKLQSVYGIRRSMTTFTTAPTGPCSETV